MFSETVGMATTKRHNSLSGFLEYKFRAILEEELLTETALLGSEELALVYCGNLECTGAKLVKLAEIQDIKHFTTITINNLKYVQPDLFLFRQNKWVENVKGTRFAGYPDLIIEVFSEGNKEDERQAKRHLYATSPITEHWYLTQDTNAVERWVGEKRLADLTLKEPLITQNGIEIDLTRLAL
ncbi:MAG: Uma2 family endonuclease [Turicibacter sp.]|nr:Uma2 family endonuclease [Turicibacter sp.]